jgi:hypothetical protein
MNNRIIRAIPCGLLLALLGFHNAVAELSVDENQHSIVITHDHYSLTFDKRKGGTIVKRGDREVTQGDAIDGYLLAADPEPEITLSESGGHVTLMVKAKYLQNGEPAPSRLRAEYRYDFHDGSPAVRLRAGIRQINVPVIGDVYGYLSWQALSIFALDDKAALEKSFGGERLDAEIFFMPGAGDPLDVSSEVKEKLGELVRPVVPKGKVLFEDSFESNKHWTDINGTWVVESGSMVERSPEGGWAWTVAGEREWSDYIVETDMLSRNGSHVYMCARWLDLNNHYELHYLAHPAFSMRINRVVKGRRLMLAEIRNLPDLRVKPFTRLALEVQGNRLRAYRNDELLLEAYDSTLVKGRIALGAVGNYSEYFHRVSVHEASPVADGAPSLSFHQPVQRHAFYRDEKEGRIAFILSTQEPAGDLTANLVLTSDLYPTHGELIRRDIPLGSLGARENREIAFTFKPALWRSGDYLLKATVRQNNRVLAAEETEIFLRRRPNPDRMLICDWEGYTDSDPEALAAHGFNQYKVYHDSTMSRWNSDGTYRTPDNPLRMFSKSAEAGRQHIINKFDDALKHGMWGFMHLAYIDRVPEGVTQAYALKRDGSGIQDRQTDHFQAGIPRMNPWHPKTVETIQDFFRKSLPAWKDLPSWRSVLLNSESDRELDVYGNAYWLDMANKELGFEVPKEVSHMWGPKGKPLPEDGIVAWDDPLYRFYRWWHERGEGQGVLHAKVAETVHEVRPDVITWHDPALRQPFVRGRLAGQDQIRHWSYAWPNVPRFSLITDEMRRAATPGQERIFMLQVIVFSDIPIPKSGPHWPHVKRGGRLYLAAHSPAIVREGTWLALSRGTSGMAYHGLSTVERDSMRRNDARGEVEGIGYRSYMYSNPDSLAAIREMSERVMQPYGMVIKRLVPARAEVVMLLSTANAVFSNRDAEDMVMEEAGHLYAKLQAAHVPVDVAFEVDLEERGLDGYKAVALPACKVLPSHLYEMIQKFENQGGLVIADQFLVPKFERVLTLKRMAGRRSGEAALEQEHVTQARDVRKALDKRITRWADCDSSSVILSVLEHGTDKVLFAINNLRRTGDYMKPWGRVLDDGVPQTAILSIPDADTIIYDALDQRVIQPKTLEGRKSWKVTLGPGEGRMFVVRPKAIDRIVMDVPESVKKGDQIAIGISIEDQGGEITKNLIPLRVEIADSQGTASDYSDYVLAQDGRATVTMPIAKNEPSGDWSIIVRELYGGTSSRAFFNVPGEDEKIVTPRKKKALPGLVQVPEMWLFRTDPGGIGGKEEWFKPGGKTEGWELLSTYDFWDAVTGINFSGDGWYALDLAIPAVKGKRIKLIFGAVDENYTLWINGTYVSDNLAAGTTMWDKPVTIDITDHYKPGQKNHFVVRVKNTIRAGGIWKPVGIVAR